MYYTGKPCALVWAANSTRPPLRIVKTLLQGWCKVYFDTYFFIFFPVKINEFSINITFLEVSEPTIRRGGIQAISNIVQRYNKKYIKP